jgi:hypothetical protein
MSIDRDDLIPVHINKARSGEYFYDWSSDIGDWVRGEKIPDALNKCYKTPYIPIKSKKRK